MLAVYDPLRSTFCTMVPTTPALLIGINQWLAGMLLSLVLLTAALIASWLPARRALRIDPVQALRYD